LNLEAWSVYSIAMASTSEVYIPAQAEAVHQYEAPLKVESMPDDEVDSIPDDEVADSALLRIRRARAFLGKQKACMLAESLSAEFEAKVADVQDAATVEVPPYVTHSGGCTQEELDALCVDEGSTEEGDEDKLPHAAQSQDEGSTESDEDKVPRATQSQGWTQEELDALCVDEGSTKLGEPSSPVDSALLRIRRARAFLGREKASLLAERLSAESHDAKAEDVEDIAIDPPHVTHNRGCTQEELDALCVDEGSTEEGEEDKPPHGTQSQDEGSTEVSDEDKDARKTYPFGKAAGGLGQEALDELCVENASSDSDAGEGETGMSKSNAVLLLAAAAMKRGVLGAEAIKLKNEDDVEMEADKFEEDALLLRVRRLRAFRGKAEAAQFAEKVCTKVEKTARTPTKPRPSRLDVQGLPKMSTSPQKEPSILDSPVLKVASPLRKRQVW